MQIGDERILRDSAGLKCQLLVPSCFANCLFILKPIHTRSHQSQSPESMSQNLIFVEYPDD